jgi:hypothetical protein
VKRTDIASVRRVTRNCKQILQTSFRLHPHSYTIFFTLHSNLLHKPNFQLSNTPPNTTITMPVTTIPFASTSEPKAQPIYFWRPTTRGNGYLSQWYSSKFTIDGDTYVTAEMWMMVQKARLFKDEETARKMLDSEDPKRHKELGRQVASFDGKVWDERESSSFHCVSSRDRYFGISWC